MLDTQNTVCLAAGDMDHYVDWSPQQLRSARNVDGITVFPTGGVDQYVDWSTTAPQRTQARPPDEEGDSVFVVSLVLGSVYLKFFLGLQCVSVKSQCVFISCRAGPWGIELRPPGEEGDICCNESWPEAPSCRLFQVVVTIRTASCPVWRAMPCSWCSNCRNNLHGRPAHDSVTHRSCAKAALLGG